MPDLELSSDEAVDFSVEFQTEEKNTSPFLLTFTNQAIHILKKKLFAVSDPFYFEKLPFDQVERVIRKKLKPFFLWLLSLIFILVGGYTTYSMRKVIFESEEGWVSGWPIAIFIAGLVIPFIARKRYCITIRYQGGTYTWKPPLLVDSASRNRVREIQDTILEACDRIHIRTEDDANPLGRKFM